MAERTTSKYVAVRQSLLARVADMEPGDRLPSEPVLCAEFGVSRITLRHAVDGLVQDGRLERQHGRGTFVTATKNTTHYPERFTDRVTGFYRQQTHAGQIVTSRVLRQALVPANERLAERLEVPFASRVVELERLRFVNGQLHQHVVTYLPYDRFPDVLTHDFETGSLFEFLANRYHVVLARNDLVVRVDEVDEKVAGLLGVEPSTRILAIESTVYDHDDRPAAFGTSRHEPDNSEIGLSLRASHAD